jgi:hypothetical protein
LSSALIVDQLEHDAERWVTDHEAVSLWRKRRLALAAEALELDDVVLSDGARAFFEAGLKAESRRRFTLGVAAAALATMAIGASASYVRAVGMERTRTQAALEGERASRLLAETRTKEVQAAQQRIDELLRGLADSSAKEEVIDLQAKIRDAPVRPRPEQPRARLPAPFIEPPSAPSASSAALPSTPRIRVREEW